MRLPHTLFGFAGLLLLLTLTSTPALSQTDRLRAMSIADAYKAVRHQQTPYDTSRTNLDPDKAFYMHDLLSLTDEALRLRIIIMQQLSRGEDVYMAEYNDVYKSIINNISMLEPPKKIRRGQELIIEAITEQHQFLQAWADAGPHDRAHRNFSKHPLVLSSHKKLLEAYYIFLKIYDDESPYNKQALYDHLCTLDFI